MVDVIFECIENERWHIHLDMMDENVREKKIIMEGNKRILLAFDRLMNGDSLSAADVAKLSKRTFYYKDLLHLFGNTNTPYTREELISEYMFPNSYLGHEDEIIKKGKEIFYLIKEATIRSMSPKTNDDIRKEEWTATTSNDPGDSLTKKNS